MRFWAWLRSKFLWAWPYDHRRLCEAEYKGRECVLDPIKHTYQHQDERGFRWAS